MRVRVRVAAIQLAAAAARGVARAVRGLEELTHLKAAQERLQRAQAAKKRLAQELVVSRLSRRTTMTLGSIPDPGAQFDAARWLKRMTLGWSP